MRAIDGQPVSCSFEQALWYAAWFTRYALDRAPDADPHPGVIGHLTAGRTQLDAAQQLQGERARLEAAA